MIGRRFGFLVIAAAVGLTLVAGLVPAQHLGTIGDVEQPVGASGKIDWSTGVVSAVGLGAPPAQPANTAQARAMAERSAQAAAYRNLLVAVKGVRINAETTAENIMVASDLIRSEVSGIIQGAMVMDKKYMADGSVEVTVGLRLTGALADAVLPKKPPDQPSGFGDPPAATAGQVYSGLIVDARGLGVKPAMSPRIVNAEGKEVYGSAWISRDWAVREGMVGYLRDPAAARSNPRVTDKTIMVKALRTSGDSRVDMVISDADAATLRGAGQNMRFLDACRVIILVD